MSGGENTTKHLSARQRRWTAFRSWYRGGRVFDRADETLIAAATMRLPPSPGSLGRPLTPRMAPADGPQPAAPTTIEGEVVKPPQLTSEGGGETGGSEAAAVSPEMTAVSSVAGVTVARSGTAPLTPLEGMTREGSTTPPAPPAPPEAQAGVTTHVTLLKTNQPAPTRVRHGSDTDEASAAAGDRDGISDDGPSKDEESLGDGVGRRVDAARLDGIAGWDAEEEGGEQSPSGYDGGSTEGLSPPSHQGGTAAAKRLRMEARRKFLAARTVNSKQAAQKVSRTRSRPLGPPAYRSPSTTCAPKFSRVHLFFFPLPPKKPLAQT